MPAIRIIDDHVELANIGTKTHAQIDSHIANPSAHHVKYTNAEAVTAINNDVEGFGAQRSSALSISASSWTNIQCDDTFFNINSGYSTVTHRYTAPKAGYYQFNANVTLGSVVDNKFVIIWIKKDGAGIAQSRAYSGGGTYTATNVSGIIYLNAGNYIEASAYHTDTVARNVKTGASTAFSAIKI